MKIIIPIINFGKSGGYRVLSKMADELITNGCEVTFIVPENVSIPYYPTKAKIKTSLAPSSKNRYFRYILKMYNLYLTTRKTEASVVIANQHLTAYLTLFLPSKIKKFYYVQANEVKIVKGVIAKSIAYLTYFFPFKKIVNAGNLLPNHINNFVSIVPAGVDLELFNRGKCAQTPLSQSEINIGFIGRKELYKGTSEILQALDKIVQNKNHQIKINIAVYKPILPIHLQDIVNFTNIDSDFDLATFYNRNDLIIATGLIEHGAFHYPCAEGMACSKLVISNYAPLVSTNSQLLLKETTVEKLQEKIELALSMSQSEVHQEIENNSKCIKNYSWDNVGKLMLKSLNI